MRDMGVIKKHRRYGVKGYHTLRTAGCESTVGVFGGRGSGFNGVNALSAADVAHLDPQLQYELLNAPNVEAPIDIGDAITSAEYRDAFFPNDTRAYVMV